MREACGQRGVHVRQRARHGLPGQGVYQVDIAAREGLQRQRQRRARLCAVVNAPDAGKRGIVKTLHAQREAIDACATQGAKARRLDCAGVGFQGDFCVGRKTQFALGGVQ